MGLKVSLFSQHKEKIYLQLTKIYLGVNEK